MNKAYLGDGVYVETLYSFDGVAYMLKLTTENGVVVTNTVYLEPEVWDSLVLYVKRRKADVNE